MERMHVQPEQELNIRTQLQMNSTVRLQQVSMPHQQDDDVIEVALTCWGASTGVGAFLAGRTCSSRPWKILPSIAAMAAAASAVCVNCR